MLLNCFAQALVTCVLGLWNSERITKIQLDTSNEKATYVANSVERRFILVLLLTVRAILCLYVSSSLVYSPVPASNIVPDRNGSMRGQCNYTAARATMQIATAVIYGHIDFT